MLLRVARGVSYYHDANAATGAASVPAGFFTATAGRTLSSPSMRRCSADRALTLAAAGTVDLKAAPRAYALPGTTVSPVPPAVIGDRVIVGGRITEDMRTDMPAEGGARLRRPQRRLTCGPGTPSPPQARRARAAERGHYRRSTANTWSVFSTDPQRNLVFIPTRQCAGRAVRHHARHRRSRLLRELGGGARCGRRQRSCGISRTVHHDVWDYDVPSQPVLFDFPSAAWAGAGARASDQAGLPVHFSIARPASR